MPEMSWIFPHAGTGEDRSIADEDTFEEWDRGIENTNPIGYKGYPEKVEALKQTTGLDEAVVTGKAAINGIETALGVCDGRFLMASMGEVVGEKITRMVERATEEKLPVIIFTCLAEQECRKESCL